MLRFVPVCVIVALNISSALASSQEAVSFRSQALAPAPTQIRPGEPEIPAIVRAAKEEAQAKQSELSSEQLIEEIQKLIFSGLPLVYLESALNAIQALPVQNILIVGMGIAELPLELARLGYDVTLVERRVTTVANAQRYWPTAPGILHLPKVILSNIDAITQNRYGSLSPHSYDLALLLSLVGEHFKGNLKRSLRNVLHLLKADGILYLPVSVERIERYERPEQLLLQLCLTAFRDRTLSTIRTIYDDIDYFSVGATISNAAYRLRPLGSAA